PGADALRRSRVAARARVDRPALRLPAGDGGPGRGRRLAGVRSGRDVPAAHRAVQGDRDVARHAAGGPRQGPGAAPVNAAGPMNTLVVLAKEPVLGRVKTRLHPPFSLAGAAALAGAALSDTLATLRRTPARRRILALAGRPGRWLPP